MIIKNASYKSFRVGKTKQFHKKNRELRMLNCMSLKGFTMLELLVVLVILSVLAIIAIPIFSNKGDEAKNTAHNQNIKILYQQGQAFVWQANSTQIGDITTKLVNDGYIKEIPTNPNTGDKDYHVIAKADGTVVVLSGYNGVCNSPQLATGMTPVKWNGTAWTKADVTNTGNDWYKYNGDLNNSNSVDSNKDDGIVTAVDNNGEKWANVMLGDGCDGNTTFNGSMFVWIPRYTYKIVAHEHESTDTTTEKETKIAIKYSVGTVDDTSDGYRVHPAFTFGGKQLTGIWVAKFEASQRGIGATGTNTNGHDDVTTIAVQSKPGVNSWRYIRVGKAFKVCRNMEIDATYGWGTSGIGIDSHLIKNVEWGAVVYLAEAIRDGEEIWVNNYSDGANTKTGAGAKSKNDSSKTDTYTYKDTDPVKGVEYSGYGAAASTTGNIYGIYDICGGSMEYVSAYINNGHVNITSHGDDNGNSADGIIMTMASNNKYVDKYDADSEDNSTFWAKATITETGETLQNAERITMKNYNLWSTHNGDAMYETSNGASGCTSGFEWWWNGVSSNTSWELGTKKGWYNDYNLGGWNSRVFFQRGGNYSSRKNSGSFDFDCFFGGPDVQEGFRPVLAVGEVD